MENYNHKRRNLFSISPHLLGLIFIAVGMFTVISPALFKSDNSITKALLVGTGAIVFGLIVVFSYGGTLINFSGKKIKEYYSICGFEIGQWKSLPEIKLIKVVSAKYKATRISDGIHPSTSGNISIFKAIFYSKSHKPVLVLEYSSKERTIREAKILSDNLSAVLELSLTEADGKFSV